MLPDRHLELSEDANHGTTWTLWAANVPSLDDTPAGARVTMGSIATRIR